MEVLRVSANSSPSSVAGAIASVMRTSGEVEVQAVGAGAVNQAVKSIAIARGYLAPVGIDLVSIRQRYHRRSGADGNALHMRQQIIYIVKNVP